MRKSVSIIGAGGHTRSLINLLELNNYDIYGIYDDSYEELNNEIINNYKLIGKISDIQKIQNVIISIGDCEQRHLLFCRFDNQVIKENLLHRKSIVEKRSIIGQSNQIFANVYINSNVTIGNNNIFNTGSIIEHETKIGDHNHISVGSIICGRISIGNNCFIGAGAVIIDKVRICNNVTIGANSVVINNIKDPGIYIGNPAVKIK
ncbi:Transferase [Candidatus Magnetomoraceae bacterium gMMP-1]